MSAQTDEEHLTTKRAFDTGAQKWLHILGDLTFATVSLRLTHDDCMALSQVCASRASGTCAVFTISEVLASRIDEVIDKQSWPRIFVKLSTRSPKDSPYIFEKAVRQFKQQDAGLLKDPNERTMILFNLIQENYSAGSGAEALELLTSSDRIREDIGEALKAPCYAELEFGIEVRRWEAPIPIDREFRATSWTGKMHAIWQYYHAFHFAELERHRETICSDLLETFAHIQPKLAAAGLESCVLDFAWIGPKQVQVIEVNPFDGVALGINDASMGLFKWSDAADRCVITEGPVELRLRTKPLTIYELKTQLNAVFRDVIFPPWSAKPRSELKAKAGAALALPPPGKGKGKCKMPTAEVMTSSKAISTYPDQADESG